MPGHPVFAAIYSRLIQAPEDAGLRDIRAGLLSQATGRTLEVGAGTGLDLPHYGAGVTELILTEPDPHMARRLRAALAAADPEAPAEIVEAPAESLPFDTRASTPSSARSCSAPSPTPRVDRRDRQGAASGGAAAVHRARSRRRGLDPRRWQDRLERPWGAFSGGCHPNRRTLRGAGGVAAAARQRRDARSCRRAPPPWSGRCWWASRAGPRRRGRRAGGSPRRCAATPAARAARGLPGAACARRWGRRAA